MWNLLIRIRRNDKVEGKRIFLVILDMLKRHDISGATVWTGVGGYGKRGDSNFKLEGVSINNPLLIETIDTKEKLVPILPEIKKLIGDNGIVTLNEVDVL